MTVPKIIALTGLPGSGKTEVRKVLTSLGYVPRRIAAPMKAMCKALGMTYDHIEGHLKEKPFAPLGVTTPRRLMQTLGRELPDALRDPELWGRLWAHTVMQEGHQKVVVEDHRYQYEDNWFRAIGVAEVWKVEREGHEPDAGAMKHAAEQQHLDSDATVFNNGTLADLRASVTLMEQEFSQNYPN